MSDPNQLLSDLLTAGLTVEEWPHWKTRGNQWEDGKPIGSMPHHTAPPIPYPVSNLAGTPDGRIKCNVNVKQDGTVWLVAYEACNYSSGTGSAVVVDEVRNAVVPPATARVRNLRDNIGGNRLFWNVEVDHPGDGSPQTLEAQTALARVHTVSADHFGYDPLSMASHAEFTRRKTDPSWDGGHTEAMAQLRALVDTIVKGPPMSDHEHTPPAGSTHSWFDQVWADLVAKYGLDDESRPWNLQREDLGWIDERMHAPLEEAITEAVINGEAALADLAGLVGANTAALATALDRIAALEARVTELEANPGLSLPQDVRISTIP